MSEKKSNGNAKKAAIAGAAAIGSAAIAAAWLFAGRRKEKGVPEKHKPKHPEDAPETD